MYVLKSLCCLLYVRKLALNGATYCLWCMCGPVAWSAKFRFWFTLMYGTDNLPAVSSLLWSLTAPFLQYLCVPWSCTDIIHSLYHIWCHQAPTALPKTGVCYTSASRTWSCWLPQLHLRHLGWEFTSRECTTVSVTKLLQLASICDNRPVSLVISFIGIQFKSS